MENKSKIRKKKTAQKFQTKINEKKYDEKIDVNGLCLIFGNKMFKISVRLQIKRSTYSLAKIQIRNEGKVANAVCIDQKILVDNVKKNCTHSHSLCVYGGA